MKHVPRIVLLWLVGCSVAFAAPPVVTDDLGREVRLEAYPRRIVSLVPSHTETLCALGACDRLVGRDTWSDHPSEVTTLPDLGSAFAPNLEAIVALRPDLVLVDEYSGAADALAALGLPVYAGTPQNLTDLHDTTRRVGALLGLDEAADALAAELDRERAAIAARTVSLTRPRVYLELDPSPYSVGPASLLGSLLTAAGADNVVPAELGDYPLLAPEFVLRSDPDLIVIAHTQGVGDRPGWSGLSAVRSGRVIHLDQETIDLLSRAGPRTVEALRRLARVVHPGVF